MPLVKKTYHCKVIRLTNTKQVALEQEYDNLQHYLKTREDRGLYSANRQQADRFYKVIKKATKYPLSIRNDLIRLEHDPSSIAEYWVRIPIKLVKCGLWIELIKPYEPIPNDAKICECKLYKRIKPRLTPPPNRIIASSASNICRAKPKQIRVAILDDYQNVALSIADSSALDSRLLV